ncbi:MAG: DUF4114 domain-containing protein [Syntrophobacterales bacterium]|jgi:hypothetical protein|nr:DUF4114 domain-containing protein [Syntrophobacterales bacterium]
MKSCRLGALVLIFLMDMAVGASAVVIQTQSQSNLPERILYLLMTDWGFPVDNASLQLATPLEGLPAGQYEIQHYARYSGKLQLLGIYPLDLIPPAHEDQLPAGALEILLPMQLGQWDCALPFAAEADFGFFDYTRRRTDLLTTQNQNSDIGPFHQSSGLILDLGLINPIYSGQYLVAFEDGLDDRPYGDLDYNDMVIQVSRVPIPGTLPLLGSGCLCLWAIGFRPRWSVCRNKALAPAGSRMSLRE